MTGSVMAAPIFLSPWHLCATPFYAIQVDDDAFAERPREDGKYSPGRERALNMRRQGESRKRCLGKSRVGGRDNGRSYTSESNSPMSGQNNNDGYSNAER